MNSKKILSIFAIVAIATVFSGILSYVRADYVEPAGAPVANNVPAPMPADDSTSSFVKKGKLGLTNNKSTNPVDTDQFLNNVLVIMGQLSAESLTSNGRFRIMAELPSNSTHTAVFLGDPTNSSFMQSNLDGSPRSFLVTGNSTVTGHTRVPRMVVGSKTASPSNYNLYVEPGTNATNLGKNNDYCTLTKDQLQNQGCPYERSYRGVKVGTYLGQVFVLPTSSSSDVVAACYIATPTANPSNIGSCY